MPTDSENYSPSPTGWVRDQVTAIVGTGDTAAASVMDREVVLLTMTGAKTGRTLKVPLMRVERDGVLAAVGSNGGAAQHPAWVANLRANPDLTVQDGTRTQDVRAREISGAERDAWWPVAVEAFPPYAEYQTKTDRLIPVFVLEPR